MERVIRGVLIGMLITGITAIIVAREFNKGQTTRIQYLESVAHEHYARIKQLESNENEMRWDVALATMAAANYTQKEKIEKILKHQGGADVLLEYSGKFAVCAHGIIDKNTNTPIRRIFVTGSCYHEFLDHIDSAAKGKKK